MSLLAWNTVSSPFSLDLRSRISFSGSVSVSSEFSYTPGANCDSRDKWEAQEEIGAVKCLALQFDLRPSRWRMFKIFLAVLDLEGGYCVPSSAYGRQSLRGVDFSTYIRVAD